MPADTAVIGMHKKPNISLTLPPIQYDPTARRSSSLGDIALVTNDSETNANSELVALTNKVQRFSNILEALKDAVSKLRGSQSDAALTEMHKQLKEVLVVVSDVLQTYPALNNSDTLLAISAVIGKGKHCSADPSSQNIDDLLADIDNLARIFSNSVSEYWLGDLDGSNYLQKSNMTKSLDCLAADECESPMQGAEQQTNNIHVALTGVALDAALQKLESGVDIALHRAQAWSKYTKDLVSYVERRSTMWGELARNLSKLAKSIQQSVGDDTFLPFHSIFSTALSQDDEMGFLGQAARVSIHNHKFVAPLNARRAEHDKTRKNIKSTWTKQLRRMHDAEMNLQKSKTAYINRQQEYEKIKNQKPEPEGVLSLSSLSGGSAAAKADARAKKKKVPTATLR